VTIQLPKCLPLALAAAGAVACGGVFEEERAEDKYVRFMNEIQREGVSESQEVATELRQARTLRDAQIALERGVDANEA
jgi:hypothetical protein